MSFFFKISNADVRIGTDPPVRMYPPLCMDVKRWWWWWWLWWWWWCMLIKAPLALKVRMYRILTAGFRIGYRICGTSAHIKLMIPVFVICNMLSLISKFQLYLLVSILSLVWTMLVNIIILYKCYKSFQHFSHISKFIFIYGVGCVWQLPSDRSHWYDSTDTRSMRPEIWRCV